MTKMVANEKINLLRDFCIIDKKDREKVSAVKSLFLKCSEFEVERLIRDMLEGIYTLEELLMKRGLM